jgi:hypothetical protein
MKRDLFYFYRRGTVESKAAPLTASGFNKLNPDMKSTCRRRMNGRTTDSGQKGIYMSEYSMIIGQNGMVEIQFKAGDLTSHHWVLWSEFCRAVLQTDFTLRNGSDTAHARSLRDKYEGESK